MLKLIQPGLARLGKIVIGERSGKNGAPVKFDHFVVKGLSRGADGNLLIDRELMGRLGEKPISLKIRLPFNDIDINFRTTLSYYRGRRLFCTGDGETAQRLDVDEHGEYSSYGAWQPFGPCGESCPDFQARRCKPLGILRVILEEQQQIGGLYEWRTTSYNSIRNVLSGLSMIKAQTGGILAWIPLTMRLVPQTVQPKDGGPPNTAYIVQVVYQGSPQQLLTEVRDLLAIRAPLMHEIRELEAGMKALPLPAEDPEDAADTQEEFYPELAEAGPPLGYEPPAAPVQRPSAAQVNDLIALAQRCGVTLTEFSKDLRTLFQWSAEATLTKKFLRETMTLPDYEFAWTTYQAKLTARQAEEEEQSLEDDVPLTPGPDAPETAHAESSESAEGEESHDVEAFTTEAAEGIQDEMVDVDADDIPDVTLDEDGLVTQPGVTRLVQRADAYGQKALLRQIKGTDPGWIVEKFRYAWVQVGITKGAKV